VSERPYVLLTAALAALGAAVAGYLTYVHYAHVTVACPTSGCEAVQSSAYAEVFGVPLGLLGLVAYLAILAGLTAPRETSRWLVLGIALSGFVFSAYLVFVQAFRIQSFCAWCLSSDVIVTLIVVVALLRVRAAEGLTASPVSLRSPRADAPRRTRAPFSSSSPARRRRRSRSR
jgi:uncharacterized membrane protein